MRDAISRKIGKPGLIKVNPIGPVTEALHAFAVCREAGYAAMVSHGERLANYNRLLEIGDTETGCLTAGPDRPGGWCHRRSP